MNSTPSLSLSEIMEVTLLIVSRYVHVQNAK